MNQRPQRPCPDCETSPESPILDAFGERVSRRGFLSKVGATAALAGASQFLPASSTAFATPSSKSKAETAVKALYDTFSDQQTAMVCLPFEHQLRSRINANWKISPITIGSDFYSNEQQDLIDQIVKGITSEEGYDRLTRQMKADGGGIGRYSMVIFGEPGTDKFQWELTGRHLTLRADGNSVPPVKTKSLFKGRKASSPASPSQISAMTRKNWLPRHLKSCSESTERKTSKKSCQSLKKAADSTVCTCRTTPMAI